MLQLLIEGLCSPSDYRLYKKEEVFPKLMSLYHSPLTEERSKVTKCGWTFRETVVEFSPLLLGAYIEGDSWGLPHHTCCP